MENDLHRRQPQWKTTSEEDNFSGRRPQRMMTSIDLNKQNMLYNIFGSTLLESKTILKRWKTASMEDNRDCHLLAITNYNQ